MNEPIHDLAHIGHAELLTPCAQDSLRFFVELFGMEIDAREGASVYLRGWGDYQRYSLKLTESDLPGLGHMAIRAWSPAALERRVAKIEQSGLGIGWIDGDHGHGPAYRFTDPDGHVMELYYESDPYQPPAHLRPALKNVPQRFTGRGAAVKRLDHVNLLASEVPANRRFAQEQLGFRLYEQIVNDDGSESGAWLSLTIAAHELIYVADHAGLSGRLHHLAFFVDTRAELLRAADLFLDADVPIEAAPSKHAVAHGMFLYVYEPGGNRVEVTTCALHIRPRLRARRVDPGRASPWPGLGSEDRRKLPHLRHAGRERQGHRTPDPAHQPHPASRRCRRMTGERRALIALRSLTPDVPGARA